jgi:hypothetical protein
VEVLGRRGQQARRHLAAVGQALRDPQVVDDRERRVEEPAVGVAERRGREVVEEARAPEVPLREELEGRDQVVLLGEAVLAAVERRIAQGAGQVERGVLRRDLAVAFQAEDDVAALAGRVEDQIRGRRVHGWKGLGVGVGRTSLQGGLAARPLPRRHRVAADPGVGRQEQVHRPAVELPHRRLAAPAAAGRDGDGGGGQERV